MPIGAPLRVTAEIGLQDGDCAGQRRFRLSCRVTLGPPPRLELVDGLPIDGDANAALRFDLPPATNEPGATVRHIECEARLRFDPERPEQGSEAELIGLNAEQLQAIERYSEQRI